MVVIAVVGIVVVVVVGSGAGCVHARGLGIVVVAGSPVNGATLIGEVEIFQQCTAHD